MLPVFLELAGRRAVVAGSTAAAAWKAELLAAAGAEVHVHAPHLSAEFRELIAAGTGPGVVVRRAGAWTPDCLDGAALAVADAASEREARAFATAAARAGVPVNVIDRPAFCTVRFAAIVNRSPVVVGISTGGAAPVLAQAVRRRIEAVLPRGLAPWAALAGRVRDHVAARLQAGAERRAFWEQLAERAFGPAPSAGDEQQLLAGRHRADAGHGRATVVGAGPGDPGLVTLAAIRVLQSADIILFEEGVSDDVLELARREARRVPLGSGGAACRAEAIGRWAAGPDGVGRHVVWLVPGDPGAVPRMRETCAGLAGAGTPVRVVPGIAAPVEHPAFV